VTRTTIEIDDDALAAAAAELGTSNKVETVNAALTYVANRKRRAEAFENDLMWGSPDLADPKIREGARR